MPPEEAVQLQEDVESYLTRKDQLAEQDGETHAPSFQSSGTLDTNTRYEQRHDKALREHDARFFEEVAALCRSTKGRRGLQGDEEEVKRIAVLARNWLKDNELPARIWLKYSGCVTGDLVRKLAGIIWAARLRGYQPDALFMVTYEALGPSAWVTRIRSLQGTWSEFNYITGLLNDLANKKNAELRKDIDHARRSFPKSAWKRVWQDPALIDIKPKRGRPKQ